MNSSRLSASTFSQISNYSSTSAYLVTSNHSATSTYSSVYSSVSNHSLLSTNSSTGLPSLTISSSLTSNNSLIASCTASDIDYYDGICNINGTTCVDYDGRFPCTCTKYSSQLHTSPTVQSAFGDTWTAQLPYFSQVPPVECSDGCRVEADRVRILFWPVNDGNATLQNVTGTARQSPYTTVSDGFTL